MTDPDPDRSGSKREITDQASWQRWLPGLTTRRLAAHGTDRELS